MASHFLPKKEHGVRILFNQRDYLTAVREQFSGFMKPEQLQAAMRTAAKRVAKHHGQISKYDGQGRRRQGFPVAGDTGGRPVYPYPLPKYTYL